MVEPKWEDFRRPTPKIQQQAPDNTKPNQPNIPSTESDPTNEEKKQNIDWGDFLTPQTYQGPIDPLEEEGVFGWLARNATANASRFAENALGAYGNIEKLGKDVLASVPESAGLIGYGISKLIGQEKWERMVRGKPGEQQQFPTSEKLKEVSEKISGGYTKPKTKGEEKIHRVSEDIGSMFGLRVPSRTLRGAFNSFGIPILANIANEVVESNGFGKDKATAAKLGAWTALSLLSNVNAPKYASELMNKGREGIPNDLLINTHRFEQRLQAVSNDPHLLHADPRTMLARQSIAALHNDLSNGRNSVRSLMTAYDGINAAKRNRDLFSLSKNDQAFAKRSIDKVRDAVRDEIMESGSMHPNALDSWTNGIQAWAVIHRSRALTNWVEGVAKGPYSKLLSGPAAGLFGLTSWQGAKAPLVAIPASVTAPVLYKTGQVAHRVWNDPRLSKYYWDAILNAQRENAPGFISNYRKLQNGLEKSSPRKKNGKPEKH